jgi:hypothetical protein
MELQAGLAVELLETVEQLLQALVQRLPQDKEILVVHMVE